MSELKAFVARKIDDGTCDPVPCVEVYLKSEADKVIAEKDKEIAELKDEIRNLRQLLIVARHEVAKARGSMKFRKRWRRQNERTETLQS